MKKLFAAEYIIYTPESTLFDTENELFYGEEKEAQKFFQGKAAQYSDNEVEYRVDSMYPVEPDTFVVRQIERGKYRRLLIYVFGNNSEAWILDKNGDLPY